MEQHEIEAHEARYLGTIPATFAQREELAARYVHYLQSLAPGDFSTVALRVERILPLLHGGGCDAALMPAHLAPFAEQASDGSSPVQADIQRAGWLERMRQVTHEEAARRGLRPPWSGQSNADVEGMFSPR
jgi:hypothetical protein